MQNTCPVHFILFPLVTEIFFEEYTFQNMEPDLCLYRIRFMTEDVQLLCTDVIKPSFVFNTLFLVFITYQFLRWLLHYGLGRLCPYYRLDILCDSLCSNWWPTLDNKTPSLFHRRVEVIVLSCCTDAFISSYSIQKTL